MMKLHIHVHDCCKEYLSVLRRYFAEPPSKTFIVIAALVVGITAFVLSQIITPI